MALAAVSQPKQKDQKVGALQGVATAFDIASSIGNLYDKFKPDKVADVAGQAKQLGEIAAREDELRRWMAESRLKGVSKVKR